MKKRNYADMIVLPLEWVIVGMTITIIAFKYGFFSF